MRRKWPETTVMENTIHAGAICLATAKPKTQRCLLVSFDVGHKPLCQLINNLQARCRICFLPQTVRLEDFQQARAAADVHDARVLGQQWLHSFTHCPSASVVYTDGLVCFVSPKSITLVCKPWVTAGY